MRYPVCKHKSHARRESFVGTRVITRDHERLRVLGGLSGAGFAGFFGIFRMAGVPPARVRLYERLREITSVCLCLRVLGGLSEAGFAGFFGIFRMAGVPPALVRWYERWTRDCERLREIMSVCVCLRVLGGLSEAGFAGFFGIFRMGEDLLTQVGSYERWTRVCERLREIMSVCVCWADCLEQDLQDLRDFLGFSGWGRTC